jgi:hypothetical protein
MKNGLDLYWVDSCRTGHLKINRLTRSTKGAMIAHCIGNGIFISKVFGQIMGKT